MRVVRDAVIIGFIVRGALWVIDHKTGVLTIVGAAVASYLAARILIWFARGVARGFAGAWRREFGDVSDERRELTQRLADDLGSVRDAWIAAERAERHSPR